MKAPSWKEIRTFPLVVVPSGNNSRRGNLSQEAFLCIYILESTFRIKYKKTFESFSTTNSSEFMKMVYTQISYLIELLSFKKYNRHQKKNVTETLYLYFMHSVLPWCLWESIHIYHLQSSNTKLEKNWNYKLHKNQYVLADLHCPDNSSNKWKWIMWLRCNNGRW